MASGLSVRFGENKLLAEFKGQPLIERALELTAGNQFAKRLVLTRTKEVYEICKAQDIEVILHELQNRNEAVRLGIEQMEKMDGCMFVPCDQPLLKKNSIVQMTEYFREKEEIQIFQLGYHERVGSPILFRKECFSELKELPEKKGGSYLVKKYPERTMIVEASASSELEDIDTREDMQRLETM